jgi:MFS family permease
VAEYRTLFWTDLLSLIGDQIAAVAVAILLYDTSGSPLLAALGYASSYLPWLIGGPVLAAWADRLPSRSVLIICDVARMILVGLAALPGLPVPLVALLVLLVAMFAPPFESARSGVMPLILQGDRYAVGVSLRDAVHQVSQLVGFAIGGAIVLAISARGALALDALTFAGSAALLRLGLRDRPARAPTGPPHLLRETLEGLAVVRRDRRLYAPLLLGMVGAAYVIPPEALAPVYAESIGHDATAVGLIMAAVAAGSVVGGLALGRLVPPPMRGRLMYPMALLGTAPLLLIGLHPGLGLSLALFALAGVLSSYQIVANANFARYLPDGARARAFGVAMTGMYSGQALAILAAGAAAQVLSPQLVIALSGVLGALGVLALIRPGAGDRA